MTNGALGGNAAPSTVGPRSLWANRPYQYRIWGNTAAAVGLSLAMFAVRLAAYSVTHSIRLSGLVTAAGQIGARIALLRSGVLADRADKRILLIWSVAAGLVIWGLLSVAETLHVLNGWEIAVVLLVATVFITIFETAKSAAIRVVIPPFRDLPTSCPQPRLRVRDLLDFVGSNSLIYQRSAVY